MRKTHESTCEGISLGDGKRVMASRGALMSGVLSVLLFTASACDQVESPVRDIPDGSNDPDISEIAPNVIKIGNITFVFQNYSEREISHYAELFRKVYRENEKYIPMSGAKELTIEVVRLQDDPYHGYYHPPADRLYFGESASEGLLAHEMVHVMHGPENGSMTGWIEEGLAGAIAYKSSESLGLTDNSALKSYTNLQLSPTPAQNGGLNLRQYGNLNGYPELQNIRYYLAAKLWLEIEVVHPGAMMEVQRRYYEAIQSGMSCYGAEIIDFVINVLGELNPELVQLVESSPLGKWDLNMDDWAPKIYSYYARVENAILQRTVGIKMLLVRKMSATGTEKGIKDSALSYRIINLTTGAETEKRTITTNEEGVWSFTISGPQTSGDALVDDLGPAENYRLIIESTEFGITETFDFSHG